MASAGITQNRLDQTPIAILDFETTGLTPGHDRVVEASVVRMEPGRTPLNYAAGHVTIYAHYS